MATVDENGQVTAVSESQNPAVITVTLNYLGKTFTDSCPVYVVTPVEKVTVSTTELSVKKGEKAAKISESCFICNKINFGFSRMIETIYRCYENEKDFRAGKK